MNGYVYAVENGDAVKIGWARDPVRRLSMLKVGSPEHHKLIGFVPATMAQEAACHALLKKWRIRGEWFRKEGAVLHFLDMIPKWPRPFVRIADDADLGRDFRSEVEDAAKTLGASQVSIMKWRIRGIPPEWQIKLFETDADRFAFDKLKEFASHRTPLQPNSRMEKSA